MFEATTLEVIKPLIAHAKPLTTVADTPLSELVRTLGVEAMPDATKDNIDSVIAAIDTRAKDQGVYHTACMQELSSVSAQGVRQTLHLTRNVVNPHLVSVIKKYDALLNNVTSAAISPFKIIQSHIADIFMDPIVNDVLDRHKNVARISIANAGVLIGQYTREDIVRLLQVSDQRDINANLRELLTEDDGVGLKKVIAVLSGQETMADVMRHYPKLSLPLIFILEALDTPNEGVPLTLTQWNANKVMLINNAVQTLINFASRYENIMKNKVLYDVTVPQKQYHIYVNHDVYNMFLEKGLTANALIGNEILKRPFRGDELLANVPKLEEVYRKEQVMLDEAYRVQLNKSKLIAMANAVREDSEQRIADENFVLAGDTADAVRARTKAVLESLTNGPYKNGDVVLNITSAILMIWYAHTDAARYMDYLLEIEQRADNTLSASEIAMLAAVRYVVAWAVSQVRVKEV